MEFNHVQETFDKMPELFDTEMAEDLRVVYQFKLSNSNWHIEIENEKCQVAEGEHEKPTVVLAMDDTTWLAICNRKTTGLQAVMTRKLKVVGNIIIADKLVDLFKFN